MYQLDLVPVRPKHSVVRGRGGRDRPHMRLVIGASPSPYGDESAKRMQEDDQ